MSLLLDTNVVSELLRARPEPAVLSWFSRQSDESLYVSAVTQAEMMLGAHLLPAGKRRVALESAVQATFDEDFSGRVLPFDAGAVSFYVAVVAKRRAVGRPIAQFDAQIAAIALHHGLQLATRNVTDFEGCDLDIVDPWIVSV